MINPLSKKIYLELNTPSLSDIAADKDRILRALKPKFRHVSFSYEVLKNFYMLLRDFDWKITVTLIQKGYDWELVKIERGDTTDRHFGYAADLGSTTVIMQIVDLNTGKVLGEEILFNHQIAFGEDILSRIFYAKDNEAHLNEIKECTLNNFRELMEKLKSLTGIAPDECDVLVIGGNTTMIHFLLGIDPWFIFHAPYAPAFNSCGFISGRHLGLPFDGLVYCFASVANYLGGDIISGILASDMTEKSELALYMDIGTNGEMVLGNNEFLLSVAGAAGPALEGGISKQGMQAKPGAVDTVKIVNDKMTITTIEGERPLGICGSGIVDLLAEMLLEGWIDFGGGINPGKSDRIVKREGEFAVAYSWDYESGSGDELLFTQTDIHRFMETKAAANTMVEYLIEASGLDSFVLQRVYMAGSFGKYLNLESAITIGLYPDLPRDRFVIFGNGSLKGAYKLLTNADLLNTAEEIIETIDYLQLGEAPDFINKMFAAKFLPHTNLDLYPSVKEKLKERKNRKV